MTARTFPANEKWVPDVAWDLRQQMRAWRQMLAMCARKPGRKSVHSLRVSTLRLQAAVEFWLSKKQAGEITSRDVRRWQRQGKKLRQALGAVRQEDVSLAKLKRVRGWADPAPDEHPLFPRESLGELDEIERHIKRRRALATKRLAAEIERRRKRLFRLSRNVESMFGNSAPAVQDGTQDPVVMGLASVAADFPVLDAENLHDFRKRIKKIRYLAEISAHGDTEAARQVALLKRMTGALGEWHDWQILAQEASRTNSEKAATYLHAQANRSLGHALKLCRQSIARLLKMGTMQKATYTASSTEQTPPRKPVVGVSNGFPSSKPEQLTRVS